MGEDDGQQAPEPHVECSSCPVAYCLAHVPQGVLAAYGVVAAGATLTEAGFAAAVAASAVGCFLCQGCLQVKERRDRLALLRRLNEAMEGKGGERLWEEWEQMVGQGEEAAFARVIHHPTEWRKVEALLRDRDAPGQAQGKDEAVDGGQSAAAAPTASRISE